MTETAIYSRNVPDGAWRLLERCESEAAAEKWVRERYKLDGRTQYRLGDPPKMSGARADGTKRCSKVTTAKYAGRRKTECR